MGWRAQCSEWIQCWKMCIIFTRCVIKATKYEDALLFATEWLERYEYDLNKYVSISPSLGYRTSSVGSAKYVDTITINHPKMSKTKWSGRSIKGGKELAIERQEKRPRLCGACGSHAYHDSRSCPSKLESWCLFSILWWIFRFTMFSRVHDVCSG